MTLYEVFPLREKLFFWQEELLHNFSQENNIERIRYKNVYEIFNHCPIHDFELKKDTVKIVDGNDVNPKHHTTEKKNSFQWQILMRLETWKGLIIRKMLMLFIAKNAEN